jgi:excisionase family DNA binding protein
MSRPRTPQTAEQLLTIKEAAKRCQVSPRSVRRWIDDEQLQPVRFGRSVRISERDLAVFITRCKKSK